MGDERGETGDGKQETRDRTGDRRQQTGKIDVGIDWGCRESKDEIRKTEDGSGVERRNGGPVYGKRTGEKIWGMGTMDGR